MFSGKIPESLGDVRGLETLDLSSNQLSGEIPGNLQKLQALQLLNLSFNNLHGDVPISGIFSRPWKVHMEANPKLCLQQGCDRNNPRIRRLLFVGIVFGIVILLSMTLWAGFIFCSRNRIESTEETGKSCKMEYPLVTYYQLRLATDSFSLENVIGRGSCGSVYRGILDGVEVAVKVLESEMTRSWKSFSAECAALKNVRHRNLVKLITTCSSIDFKNTNFLALIYEFMSNGSLEDWLTGKRTTNEGKGLSFVERLNVIIDIASALDYLHHQCEVPVVHCDLKPGNVLLNSDMTAKIGDFGLARLLIERNGDQTSISSTNALKGSIGYIPPEYGIGEKASTAGDVYSFGILLLEVFTGKSPIHKDFTGGLSLKNWVQMAFPTDVEQVLDHNLLPDENNLPPDEQCIYMKRLHDCFAKIISVGLSCVADSPVGRISITNALCSLKSVKDAFLLSSSETSSHL